MTAGSALTAVGLLTEFLLWRRPVVEPRPVVAASAAPQSDAAAQAGPPSNDGPPGEAPFEPALAEIPEPPPATAVVDRPPAAAPNEADGPAIAEVPAEPAAVVAKPAREPIDVAERLKQPIRSFDQPRPVPARDLLSLLEEMLGVPVKFDRKELGPAAEGLDRAITLRLQSTTVGDILQAVVDKSGLAWEVNGETIRLRPRPPK